jgi:uncharacterized Zn finger protein (UPF0148 family)
MKFKCPSCGKVLNVKDSMAGKKANCPACKKPLTIPSPSKSARKVNKKKQPKKESVCPECGGALEDGSIICFECGYNIKTGEKPSSDPFDDFDDDYDDAPKGNPSQWAAKMTALPAILGVGAVFYLSYTGEPEQRHANFIFFSMFNLIFVFIFFFVMFLIAKWKKK